VVDSGRSGAVRRNTAGSARVGGPRVGGPRLGGPRVGGSGGSRPWL